MSNAVDILLIDGPKHGTMHCLPRPPSKFDVFGVEVPGGVAVYTPTVVTINSQKYWVAMHGISVMDPVPTILATNHQPAWDLN